MPATTTTATARTGFAQRQRSHCATNSSRTSTIVRHDKMASSIGFGSHRLCVRCHSIDLNKLLQQANVEQAGLIDHPLGPISSWEVDSCEFCQFLLHSLRLSPQTKFALDGVFKLTPMYLSETLFGVVARSLPHDVIREKSFAIESSPSGSNIHRTRTMVVLLEGTERLSRNPTFPTVDFATLSGWLTYTASSKATTTIPSRTTFPTSPAPSRKRSRTSHKSSEAMRSRVLTLQRARQSILSLDLIVIDCATRHLVPLPITEEYVTLSYVWGRPSGQIKRGTPRRPDSVWGSRRLGRKNSSTADDESIPMPWKLPRTLEDSITVCNALQYRYLWIDRYCIPQDDLFTRMEQIRRMDDVYFASALTLIACAGAGPHHGLPGVSRPRQACPTFRLDKSRMLHTIPTVQDIHASDWASRAWTYQEGLLAQRRLFFTDRQVYFESNDLVESEFTTRTEVVTRVLDPRICSQVTSPTFSGGIHECIEEYTFRKLTFPSDILNALSGILTYYTREHHILHFWGIPFSVNTPSSINEPPRKRIITFEESLRWYPRSFQARRQGFPSWSWSGWHGSVTWHGWRSDLKPASAPLVQGAVHVEVEATSGQLLSWAEYSSRYSDFNDNAGHEERSVNAEQLTPYVHVSAFVTRIVPSEDTAQEHTKLEWNHFGLETTEGSNALPLGSLQNPLHSIDMTSQFLTSQPDSLLAVHFPGWQDAGEEPCASILVVRRHGNYWERIALLDDDAGNLQYAKKSWTKIRLG